MTVSSVGEVVTRTAPATFMGWTGIGTRKKPAVMRYAIPKPARTLPAGRPPTMIAPMVRGRKVPRSPQAPASSRNGRTRATVVLIGSPWCAVHPSFEGI